jgi:hypothetical protein
VTEAWERGRPARMRAECPPSQGRHVIVWRTEDEALAPDGDRSPSAQCVSVRLAAERGLHRVRLSAQAFGNRANGMGRDIVYEQHCSRLSGSRLQGRTFIAHGSPDV